MRRLVSAPNGVAAPTSEDSERAAQISSEVRVVSCCVGSLRSWRLLRDHGAMARSGAATVEEYLAELPSERAEVVRHVRRLVLEHLPDGIEESMNFGMIAYEIPLERYPDTYNGQPLMYAALAANKNNFSLHLHGAYASSDVAQRLRDAYEDAGMKLDMGKSCIRFTRADQLHEAAITDAITSVDADAYIELYEASRPG